MHSQFLGNMSFGATFAAFLSAVLMQSLIFAAQADQEISFFSEATTFTPTGFPTGGDAVSIMTEVTTLSPTTFPTASADSSQTDSPKDSETETPTTFSPTSFPTASADSSLSPQASFSESPHSDSPEDSETENPTTLSPTAFPTYMADTDSDKADSPEDSETENPTTFSPTAFPTINPDSSPSDPSEPPGTGMPTTFSPTGFPTKMEGAEPSANGSGSFNTAFPTFFHDLYEDCPNDIRILNSSGSTPYPTGKLGESDIAAVKVLLQETSTVTVELRQAWDATVDRYFYSYEEKVFVSKCNEETEVKSGEVIDTIKINCGFLSKAAFLMICLQDESDSLLTATDTGTVPQCCHSVAEESTPTVCYELSILCDTTCGLDAILRHRNLRGEN